jgi:hypothetical protein
MRARVHSFVADYPKVGSLAIKSSTRNHSVVADSDLRFYTTLEYKKNRLDWRPPLVGGDDYRLLMRG